MPEKEPQNKTVRLPSISELGCGYMCERNAKMEVGQGDSKYVRGSVGAVATAGNSVGSTSPEGELQRRPRVPVVDDSWTAHQMGYFRHPMTMGYREGIPRHMSSTTMYGANMLVGQPPVYQGPYFGAQNQYAMHTVPRLNGDVKLQQHNWYRTPQVTVSPTSADVLCSMPVVMNKPTKSCLRCGTTQTPEWRRGPHGVRTLCNACGLYHAKLVKRKGPVLAAQEILHSKVCKGKNWRRISIKKEANDEPFHRLMYSNGTSTSRSPF